MLKDIAALARELNMFVGPISLGILVGILAARLGMSDFDATLVGVIAYQSLALLVTVVQQFMPGRQREDAAL